MHGMSMAKEVKAKCESVGRGGFSLSAGVLWQSGRVNARPMYFHRGKLLAERTDPNGSGFQTDALYQYSDGSMLIVHRTADSYKPRLAATKKVNVWE